MTINGIKTNSKKFAFDGCHKFYILEDAADIDDATANGYEICDIDQLPGMWADACPLRFISNWKLTKEFCKQFNNADFSDGYELRIIVDTAKGRIDILHTGYNIIAKSIYNGDTAQKIIELLKGDCGDVEQIAAGGRV